MSEPRGVRDVPSPPGASSAPTAHAAEGAAAPARTNTASFRELLNPALFIVLVVLTVLWFHRHLQPWFAESLYAGGTLTALALLKLGYGALKWSWPGGDKQIPPTLLAGRYSTGIIATAVVVAAVLLCVTSSVYAVYGDKAGKEQQFALKLTRPGEQEGKAVRVGASEKVKGRIFLPGIWPFDATVTVVEPDRFHPKAVRLRPWSAVRVRVPDDLAAVEFNVLRLVPTKRLYQRMAPVGGPANVVYELRVRPQAAGARGEYVVSDWRRQPVFLGGNAGQTRWVAEAEDAQRRAAALEAKLVSAGADPAQVSQIRKDWESNALHVTSDVFAPGTRVQVVVHRRAPVAGARAAPRPASGPAGAAAEAEAPVVDTVVEIKGGVPIQTECLGD